MINNITFPSQLVVASARRVASASYSCVRTVCNMFDLRQLGDFGELLRHFLQEDLVDTR